MLAVSNANLTEIALPLRSLGVRDPDFVVGFTFMYDSLSAAQRFLEYDWLTQLP